MPMSIRATCFEIVAMRVQGIEMPDVVLFELAPILVVCANQNLEDEIGLAVRFDRVPNETASTLCVTVLSPPPARVDRQPNVSLSID
jgi:hypothetical protein